MNVGYRPIARKGVPALERSRLSHVFQGYVRPETLAAANAPLVARQAGLPATRNHRVSRSRHLRIRRIPGLTGHCEMLHRLQ